MQKVTITIMLMFCSFFVFSQNIGHTTITFNDPTRTGGTGAGGGPGRQIQTEIYYPAVQAGTDVAIQSGSYPIVVFGHGFGMVWSAYENIWDFLVPNGYIVAFPVTEGSLLSPSHDDFGKDLALVVDRLLDLSNNQNSIFYQKVNGNAGIAGHSMGGGASFLAGQNNQQIKTIIGLAAAETNPSAINAASGVVVPTLIFSGSADDVTPDVDHQIPIHEALDVSCKYLISLEGAGHCNFANANGTCELGELFSLGNITMSREEHHLIVNGLMLPWLDYYLKDELNAWSVFVSNYQNESKTTVTSNCVLSVSDFDFLEFNIYPNPVKDKLYFENNNVDFISKTTITNLNGKVLIEKNKSELQSLDYIDVSVLSKGSYLIHFYGGNTTQTKSFIKF